MQVSNRIGQSLQLAKRCVLVGALCLVFSSLSAFGQATGQLMGTVMDETGAVVPGADVTVRNMDTGQVLQSVTGAQGGFRFPDISIGMYEIEVKLPGFKTLVQRRIGILTGRTVDLRLTLQIGEVLDSLEVVGTTPMVQTSDAEVKSTIDSRAMKDLPLNGRNPLQLVVLTPGAHLTSVSSRTTPEQGGFGNNPGITVNGLPATDNNYRVDGGSYNNPQNNVPPTLPNPDTLQEFTVKSSNYSAEFTRAGAVVLLSTRSGGNEFHGSAFEFLRNDKLDARNFFAEERAPFKRNQFGATFGGRIIRDKTFFFTSYQGTRKRGSPSQKRLDLPTPAERAGDFSARGRTIVDPINGQPFPNNVIPVARFSAPAVKLLEIIPLPASGTSSLFVPKQTDQDDDHFLIRGDHHFSETNQFSARYFYDQLEAQRDTRSIQGVFGQVTFENQLLGLSDTHTFSPNFTFNSSFNWTYTTTLLRPNTPLTLQSLGVDVPLATEQSVPELRVTISGLTRLFSGGLLDFDPQVYEWRNHASWQIGSHLLRFGVDVEHAIEDARDVSNGSGQFTFGGDRTSSPSIPNSGSAFADFLLGLPGRFDQRATSPQEMEENKVQPWVQFDWRIHPRFTLNLGLRWEPWLATTDNLYPLAGLVPGVQSTVAPDAPTALVFAGAGVSDLPGQDGIFQNDWNNWAPRIGWAWDLGGDGRTVIRSGFGIFYRSFPLNIIRDTAQRIAFRGLEVLIDEPPTFQNPFADTPGGSPFTTPFSPPPLSALSDFKFLRPVGTGALDPFARSSYTQSWNLTVERQVMPDVSFSLGYVGNHSVKIVKGREGNPGVFGPGATRGNVNSRRIFPGLSSVRFRTPDYENANYHGLQFNIVRRSATGLNFLANYVFAKAIDINTSGSLGGTTLRNPFNPQMDRGPADTDISHRMNLSFLYPVPALVSGGGVAGGVLNNWQVNGIITAYSGLPFSIRAGRDRSLVGVNRDLADLVAGSVPEFNGDNLAQTFNVNAFGDPALGTFGNSGRNLMNGPAFVTLDMSLFKTFPLGETAGVQFRLESFNLLNSANFENPDNRLTSRNFARIQSAKDPRIIQVGLKLMF